MSLEKELFWSELLPALGKGPASCKVLWMSPPPRTHTHLVEVASLAPTLMAG